MVQSSPLMAASRTVIDTVIDEPARPGAGQYLHRAAVAQRPVQGHLLRDYASVPELGNVLERYFHSYNYERPHAALQDRTPAEVHWTSAAAIIERNRAISDAGWDAEKLNLLSQTTG